MFFGPLREIEDHLRNIGDGTGVILQDFQGFFVEIRPVQLGQGILKIAESGHTVGGSIDGAEAAIQLEGALILTRALGATSCRFRVACELVHVARLAPSVDPFQDRGGHMPEVCVHSEIRRFRFFVAVDELLDRLFSPAGGADDLHHFLPHTEISQQRYQEFLFTIDLCLEPADLAFRSASGLLKRKEVAEFFELANSQPGRFLVVSRVGFGDHGVVHHPGFPEDLRRSRVFTGRSPCVGGCVPVAFDFVETGESPLVALLLDRPPGGRQ